MECRNGNLWKLKTTVYGLCDAPRAWYLTVKKEILKTKCQKSKYDDAIFFCHHDGQLQGLMCCHVDDFFGRGTEFFKITVIDVLK